MSWLPPFWMRLRVSQTTERGFRLWFPLFLLWPAWMLALLLFLITTLLATALTGSRNFRAAILATRELHALASALRGTEIELCGRDKQLSFSFV